MAVLYTQITEMHTHIAAAAAVAAAVLCCPRVLLLLLLWIPSPETVSVLLLSIVEEGRTCTATATAIAKQRLPLIAMAAILAAAHLRTSTIEIDAVQLSRRSWSNEAAARRLRLGRC